MQHCRKKLHNKTINNDHSKIVVSLQHNLCTFTTKTPCVCNILKAHKQHKNRRKAQIAGNIEKMQHPVSSLTTKLIHIHYIFKSLMKHQNNPRKTQILANVQNILQHLASSWTTYLIHICYIFKSLMQHQKIRGKHNLQKMFKISCNISLHL